MSEADIKTVLGLGPINFETNFFVARKEGGGSFRYRGKSTPEAFRAVRDALCAELKGANPHVVEELGYAVVVEPETQVSLVTFSKIRQAYLFRVYATRACAQAGLGMCIAGADPHRLTSFRNRLVAHGAQPFEGL